MMGTMSERDGRSNVVELMVAALRRNAALLALLPGSATVTLHVNRADREKPVVVEVRVKV